MAKVQIIQSFVFNNRLNKLFLWYAFVFGPGLFYLGKLMYNVILEVISLWDGIIYVSILNDMYIWLLESSSSYLIINKKWVYSMIT